MSDSTSLLEQVATAQSQKEVTVNALFDAVSAAASYGRHAEFCAGLLWGYYGTRWGGTAVANGTNSCTSNTTTYMVAHLTTGAVTFSTSTANWDNPDTYGRCYKIVTGTSTVTSYEDHRVGTGGILAGGGAATPGGGSAGRHAVFVSASSFRPSVTGGCAPLAAIASAANQPDIVTLNFDATTQEFAQFSIAMPLSWDEGTVSFVAHWSHAATTTNFGVAWSLQGVAVSESDPIAVAFGTAQTATDTGGTTDDLYTSPESSAITVAGSPSSDSAGSPQMVFFRLSRDPANGSDTMAIDARLHGITLFITTDAETDA